MQLLALLLLSAAAAVNCHELVEQPGLNKAHVEVNSEADFSTDDVFVPTDEWQEVRPGQAVPKGLHIRINLETGKKEAKLLDEQTKQNEAEQQDSIKRIDDDGAIHTTSNNLRSYQELQDFLAREKMKLNSEFEHVENLMSHFHNASIDRKLTILEDLEYYLHQVDNARDFVALGGMSSIVRAALDSEEPEIRSKGAVVFGACVQSHPGVQDRVLGAGWMPELLNRLVRPGEVSEVRLRLLHAVTSLVRGNEAGLGHFRNENGFATMLKLCFDRTGQIEPRMAKKVLLFIADLAELSEDNEPEAQLVTAGPVFHKVVESVVNLMSNPADLDHVEKRTFLLHKLGQVYGFHFKSVREKDKLFSWAEQALETVTAENHEHHFDDVILRLEAILVEKKPSENDDGNQREEL